MKAKKIKEEDIEEGAFFKDRPKPKGGIPTTKNDWIQYSLKLESEKVEYEAKIKRLTK